MILVTGASGAIGSRLVRQLVNKYGQNKVLTLTRTPFDVPGSINQLHDLMNPIDSTIMDILGGVNGIVHLAAEHNVGHSRKDPGHYYRHNLTMTNNILDYAIRQDLWWFSYVSTGMVYAPQHDPRPSKEDDATEPGNPYALSKLMCEHLVDQVCRYHAINSNTYRVFNVYTPAGPLDVTRSRFLIPSLINSAITGVPFDLFVNHKKNNQTLIRDYIHVDDVVNGILHGIEGMELDDNDPSLGENGQLNLFHRDPEIYNICTGVATSVLDAVEAVQEITGKKIPVTVSHADVWEGYFVGDPSRAMKNLGWKANITLRDMIEEQWRIYEQ